MDQHKLDIQQTLSAVRFLKEMLDDKTGSNLYLPKLCIYKSIAINLKNWSTWLC